MKRNSANFERIVSFIGFLFLIVAFVSSRQMDGDRKSIIEVFADSKTVISITHLVCALISLILIIKPSYIMMAVVLFIESTLTLLTGYEQLGIFFFYAICMLIVAKNIFNPAFNQKIIIILFAIHLITIFGTCTHGWTITSITLGASLFSMVFYYWIYYVLREKFSCYIPKNITFNKSLSNKKVGSLLKLSDLGLSERQASFILDQFQDNSSYKDLSDKYNCSVSTVKREFTDIFKIFGVSNLGELHLLLLQYQLEK